MGVEWNDQKLRGSVLDVLDQVRSDMRDGTFNTKTWDHNHDERVEKRSNKQVWIVGRMLRNRPIVNMDDAWDAVFEAVLGRRR